MNSALLLGGFALIVFGGQSTLADRNGQNDYFNIGDVHIGSTNPIMNTQNSNVNSMGQGGIVITGGNGMIKTGNIHMGSSNAVMHSSNSNVNNIGQGGIVIQGGNGKGKVIIDGKVVYEGNGKGKNDYFNIGNVHMGSSNPIMTTHNSNVNSMGQGKIMINGKVYN